MLWITTQAKALSVGLALIPLAFTTACALPGPRAMVVSVGDGDTIRVRKDDELITVRLACIDAPESAQRPYGQESRRELQQRLPVGSSVRLAEKTTDRYGRLVAEVFSDRNINLAMVEDGQAFAYRKYPQECDANKYLDAEGRASRRRTGVWQVEGGITRPWDFRRQLRSRKR
jgi:endonuclease YncB( thermonuclease family)